MSHDIGFTKPSPVIFEQALRKLGLPPEAVLHVGDRRSEDFDGACAAGMSAVLLDRRAASGDHTVSSLKELSVLLA